MCYSKKISDTKYHVQCNSSCNHRMYLINDHLLITPTIVKYFSFLKGDFSHYFQALMFVQAPILINQKVPSDMLKL